MALFDKLRKAVNTTALRTILTLGFAGGGVDAILDTTTEMNAQATNPQITDVNAFVKDFEELRYGAYGNDEAFRTSSYLAAFSKKYPNARAVIDANLDGKTYMQYVAGLTDADMRGIAVAANNYTPSVTNVRVPGSGNSGVGANGQALSAEEIKNQQFDQLVSMKYELGVINEALKPEFQSRVKTNAAEIRNDEDKASRRRNLMNAVSGALITAGGEVVGGRAGEVLVDAAQDYMRRQDAKEQQRNNVDIFGDLGDLQNAIIDGSFNAAEYRLRVQQLNREISQFTRSTGMSAEEQLRATKTAQVLLDETVKFMTMTPKEREKALKKESKEDAKTQEDAKPTTTITPTPTPTPTP